MANHSFRYTRVEYFLNNVKVLLDKHPDVYKVVQFYLRRTIPPNKYAGKVISGSKAVQVLKLFELKVEELSLLNCDNKLIDTWVSVSNLFYAQFTVVINKYRGVE